ncbi:MAG TPA: DUF2283 domain-containing protein [Candidatus Paceibacterota bacterium]
MKLYYYYDKEADVLYFSKGKPSAKDQAQETQDDVVLRLDPKTREVRGFTVLNFLKRLSPKNLPLPLPLNIEFRPA